MSEFLNFQDVPVVALDELVQSGDIELGRGNIISKIDIRAVSGLYPIYSSSSKNNGMMGRYGKFMFDEEMVTWSVDGGGTFFYRPRHKFSVTNVSGYMRANQEKFDYKFLHGVLDYQHSFLNFDYQSKAHPSVIRELYEIPIPPLPEQKKIASILTSVDEVIENTQKQIDKLQDLKKATMNELLTKGIGHTEFKDSELGRIPKSWEVVPVEELCSEIVDCVNKTAPVSEQPTPFKMIRTTNVRNGRVDIENVRFVSEETFKVWTRRGTLKEGDIVFTREAPVGEYGLVTKPDGLFLGQRTMLYRPDETKTNPTYLMHCFATNLTKKQLEDMTGGSTVGHMRVPDCSKIKFLKCQLEEQNAIVKVLSSVDNRIEQVAIKLSQTQSLKKSLMQDLLTGKVRVTVN